MDAFDRIAESEANAINRAPRQLQRKYRKPYHRRIPYDPLRRNAADELQSAVIMAEDRGDSSLAKLLRETLDTLC